MRHLREPFELDWARVHDATDLPQRVLHGLVITVDHTASHIPWEGVRKAFKATLGGQPSERKVWRGVEMLWDGGKIPVRVCAKRRSVRVHALTRVTPARLQRLIEALAAVPNTGHVALRAHVDRFTRDTGNDVQLE